MSVQVYGEPRELSPGLDLTAFRIVQEGLTNVLKHARPPECEIEVRYEGEHLSLAVIDHGTRSARSGPGAGCPGWPSAPASTAAC